MHIPRKLKIILALLLASSFLLASFPNVFAATQNVDSWKFVYTDGSQRYVPSGQYEWMRETEAAGFKQPLETSFELPGDEVPGEKYRISSTTSSPPLRIIWWGAVKYTARNESGTFSYTEYYPIKNYDDAVWEHSEAELNRILNTVAASCESRAAARGTTITHTIVDTCWPPQGENLGDLQYSAYFSESTGGFQALIDGITDVLLAVFSALLSPVLYALVTFVVGSLSELITWSVEVMYEQFTPNPTEFITKYLGGTATQGITTIFMVIGLAALLLIFILSLYINLHGPILGLEESIPALVLRTIIFGTAMFLAYPLLREIYKIGESLMSIITSMGADYIKPENLMMMFQAEQTMQTLPNLIWLVLYVLIIWNFLKLLLEVIERWVITSIMFMMAPFPIACGVSRMTSGFTKQFFKIYVGQVFVLAMNRWFLILIAIVCSNAATLVYKEESIGRAVEITPRLNFLGAAELALNFDAEGVPDYLGTLLFLMVILTLLKVAQKFDEYLNEMGFSALRTGGNLIGEAMTGLAVVRGAFGVARQTYSGLGRMAKKGVSELSPAVGRAAGRDISASAVGSMTMKGSGSQVPGILKGKQAKTFAAQMQKTNGDASSTGMALSVKAARDYNRGIDMQIANTKNSAKRAALEASKIKTISGTDGASAVNNSGMLNGTGLKAKTASWDMAKGSGAATLTNGKQISLSEGAKPGFTKLSNGFYGKMDGKEPLTTSWQQYSGIAAASGQSISLRGANHMRVGTVTPDGSYYAASHGFTCPASDMETAFSIRDAVTQSMDGMPHWISDDAWAEGGRILTATGTSFSPEEYLEYNNINPHIFDDIQTIDYADIKTVSAPNGVNAVFDGEDQQFLGLSGDRERMERAFGRDVLRDLPDGQAFLPAYEPTYKELTDKESDHFAAMEKLAGLTPGSSDVGLIFINDGDGSLYDTLGCAHARMGGAPEDENQVHIYVAPLSRFSNVPSSGTVYIPPEDAGSGPLVLFRARGESERRRVLDDINRSQHKLGV